jgi:hypothetical protein
LQYITSADNRKESTKRGVVGNTYVSLKFVKEKIDDSQLKERITPELSRLAGNSLLEISGFFHL